MKVRNLRHNEEGFTLIEIVLVLAIAGLILLIVFLAVSGAQKSRRDTQRKEDVSRITSQLESYASNNAGAYPTSQAQLSAFATTYMTPNSDYSDPSSGTWYGTATSLVYGNGTPATPGYIEYDTGYVCNGSVMGPAPGGSQRDYAIVMDLEQGTTCRSNQ
jgi:prepilin-type N-terminal cleavage/methylation domain-containing protein